MERLGLESLDSVSLRDVLLRRRKGFRKRSEDSPKVKKRKEDEETAKMEHRHSFCFFSPRRQSFPLPTCKRMSV